MGDRRSDVLDEHPQKRADKGIGAFEFILEQISRNDDADSFRQRVGVCHTGFIIDQGHFAEDTALVNNA